ncbi:hypothetical protein HG535_0H02550 [Zygotorulaspora mrakii]|uniref:FAD-binding FR-type domain-containing protein n=1 Tax=Zygotorulaspora mrakii TaxID=42260 RepID=A0A7H9B847_ZYGMR|nr:uncharacterized protein HG535_0H02550 [Zygotorulaspora mrakii]QLG74928.1 hypothetical protein HG535_0H02550 [Zygotorulaspora mrakii]
MYLLRHALNRRFSSLRSTGHNIRPKNCHRRFKFAAFSAISGSLGALTYLLYNQYSSLGNNELSQGHFTSYRISNKHIIDENHFLMELTPLIDQKINLWKLLGSEKMWSVQVKQPQIMVVRNYTPLPLIFNKATGAIELLKDGQFAGGKLLFYLKSYEHGEVARWLQQMQENEIVELRGPYIEYELPKLERESKRSRDFLLTAIDEEIQEEKYKFQPFDIAMYTAGTGIVTALQLMLTESPFRGTIDLFHSCKDFTELGPLMPLILKLERYKRLRLHLFESSHEPSRELRLTRMLKETSTPFPYQGSVVFREMTYNNVRPVLALVCGPDSFISSIASPKLSPYQGPVGGILEKKGWTSDNLFKLS